MRPVRSKLSSDRPRRSKRPEIYGNDVNHKLHLLAIVLTTQASMKNQEGMMTQWQRFLATLSHVSSQRFLRHGLATALSDYQVVVLTVVILTNLVLQ